MPQGFYPAAGKGGGPSPFTNAFSGPNLNSLRYNTSQYGSPLCLVYGTQRVSVNLLEEWGFSVSAGGGKGGKGLGASGGKKGSNQNYAVNAAFALGQGPLTVTGAPGAIGGFNRVWSNGGIAGFNQVSLNAYAGSDGQAADPVFLSADPNSPVIGYSGTAYVTGTPIYLGASPALPNISFEVGGACVGTIGAAYPGDANPAAIVADLLTNFRYGAGFPAANLDAAGSLADFGNYCAGYGLAMSIVLDRLQPCARWLEEICEVTAAAPVWSGALLKIVPYGNSAVPGWTPDLTTQYSLGDGDFLDFGSAERAGSDPVVVTRKDPATMTNWLAVEFMDTNNSYNPAVLPVWDQALIDQHGLRSQPPVQAHGFTNQNSAFRSAQLMLQRKAYVGNAYRFKLGFRYALLEPMDIVALTDANTGLLDTAVRIVAIDEDDNGELTVTAEELPGIVSLPVYNRQAGSGTPVVDAFADPGDANPPVVFEPPAGLTGGALEVWVVATGGSPDWGGCQVWGSTDGNTYALLGTIFAGARQGVLTAPLPSRADPDTADTLSVDLTMSLGKLLSGTQADADGLVTLCCCDGELLSYETATLTAACHYNLTYLRRGAYGTAIAAHAAGAQFARFGPNDPSVFKYAYPQSFVGRTLYLKLASFNTTGQSLQSLAALAPYRFSLTGAGAVVVPNNPVIAGLQGGSGEDWGHTADAIVEAADFGTLGLAAGLDISLGASLP